MSQGAETIMPIVFKAKDEVSADLKKLSDGMKRTEKDGKTAFSVIGKSATVALTGVKKVAGAFGSLLGTLGKFTGIGALIGGGGLGLGFVKVMKDAANFGDEIQKMSQRLGLSTELLSELRFQAELSGTAFANAASGYKILARNMFEARNGVGAAVSAFDELGISITDASGNLRPMEDVIGDIADKFASMEDGSTKTALAMKVFSDQGADLIPLLNSGRSGLKEMADEARKLGLVLDESAANKAAHFNDMLSTLNASLTGLKFQFALSFFEDLSRLMKSMADWIAENRDSIVGFLRDVANGAKTIIEAIVKSFTNENISKQLGIFFESVFTSMFESVGSTAGASFINSFISAVNKANRFLLNKVFGGYADLLLGKSIEIPTIDAEESNFLFTLETEIEALLYVLDQEATKVKVAAENVKKAIDEGLSGGTGAGDDSTFGPWRSFANGFQAAAERIKAEFEDMTKIGTRFAGDLHATLSNNFFAAMNRELTSLKDFFTATFEGIASSIKSILSDLLASRIVGLFADILGGGGIDIGGAGPSSIYSAPFGSSIGSSGLSGTSGPLNGIDFGANGSSAGRTVSGSTGGTNVNIYAMDADSFAGFLAKNGSTLVGALAGAASSNSNNRAMLQGAVR